ncbi:MAG TPA: hypothetical protein VIM11_05380 [Tepidisphaeraceae bacterium]
MDRGLTSLLDRYFVTHRTPQAERDGIKSMIALRELNDKKLSNAERQLKLRQVVDGIAVALPTLRDPVQLAKQAATLLEVGVARDVNTLEYWGENPATQARLKPVAEAVYKMLGHATTLAKTRADEIASKINATNQETVGAQWDKMDSLAHSAEYSQNMMVYDVALAVPIAERAAVVEKAVAYLTELDTPESQVQGRVRVMLGKLNLVQGKYEDAIRLLDSVETDDKISPPAAADQKYEARYFKGVAQLQAGQLKQADDSLESLIKWEKTAMPTDDVTQKGIAAAAEMLRFRILSAQADQSRDPIARKNASDAAQNVLVKLSNDRQELRGIIFQQMAERMPKDAPVAGMDPLLLQGLMAKSYDEANKPAPAMPDKIMVQRGLDACAEILRRRGAAGVTPQLLDEAARLTPVLMEAMGNRIEAANTFLKYAQEHASTGSQAAQGALDDAGRLTFELRKLMGESLQVSDLYDRFLPTALGPPFNHKELAYLYAQRLRLQNKLLDAMKYYRMVDKKDKNYLPAQFAMMQLMQDLLATGKLAEPLRTTTAEDLVKQAGIVRTAYGQADDAASRERSALATLAEAKAIGADLKKPKQSLVILNGFEKSVAGTPDEKILVGDAMLTRVNAQMAMGELKGATDSLVALLNTTGGAQGAEYVRGLLDRLDKDLEKAQAAHDNKTMLDVARSEANLSGFLVDWARSNASPEIKNFTYQYMVFDARTKRLAGALEEDKGARKTLLGDAMAAYQNLLKPENKKLYQLTLDQKKVTAGDIDPEQPDPNVELGIALTDYELADYQHASEFLGTLLNTGKLGGPTLAVQDATSNEQRVVDNDTYWEATYKLYHSNAELAKAPGGPSLDATRQGLKNLLIRGGIPPKWQDSFEALRKQIVPDFDVVALLAATTQPSPTSKPAGSQ